MMNCVRYICVSLMFFAFSAFSAVAQDMTTVAKQAIIIDYESGQVLFEKNADDRMPTSSMSKVMTMYLVFEALKDGKLSLDDELLVSEKAWKKGGSKMWVEVGKTVKVEDLIRGVVVQSGNDATIVLAEGLAGSEDAFATALTRKAKRLGMGNSQFKNASGWPDPDHYSTARDLAVLASAMVRNFPEYYGYYAEKEFTYSNITQPNRNPLLYRDIGADGMKTGHTEDGGYGLIGTGVKDGRRVIMVLNGMESDAQRRSESTRLLQWALNGFARVSLFENQKPLDQVPVYMGRKNFVRAVAQSSVSAVVPKLSEDDLKVHIEYQSPVKAPVSKGQKLGSVRVQIPKGGDVVVPLVAAEGVDAMSGFMAWITKARLLSTGQGYLE